MAKEKELIERRVILPLDQTRAAGALCACWHPSPVLVSAACGSSARCPLVNSQLEESQARNAHAAPVSSPWQAMRVIGWFDGSQVSA